MIFSLLTVADTAEGQRSLQKRFDLVPGVNRVTADLPAGHLCVISAEGKWAADRETRIFMNGYQSWTSCPEYRIWDRIVKNRLPSPTLIERYGIERYGDYHFAEYPEQRGVLHGFSYCYFRDGKKFRFLGSLDEAPGYTMISFDARTGVLTLKRDCTGVVCGGEYPVFSLYYAEGSEEEIFDGWFAAMGITPRPAEPLKGYTSWYNHYEDIDQKSILSDLEGCKRILEPGDLFQIDDGWEPAVGDWLTPDEEKFPDGIRAASLAIHNAGFKAGLWLAPFVCCETSALLEEHPDWLLLHDGKPWSCGCNWGGFCSLDIDNPEVEDYIRSVFRRVFDEWDIDLVKLDFLYAAAPFGTETETRAARMSRAIRLIRECCGDHPILACGVPLMPAFGQVEYCRIGCDVGLDWDDVPYMRLLHRERVSTKNSLGNTVFRRQLDGRAWKNDPDVFFLREDNLKLTPEQKTVLAETDALLGSVFLTSDNPAHYSEETIAEYRRLRALCGAKILSVDTDGSPMIRYIVGDVRERRVGR